MKREQCLQLTGITIIPTQRPHRRWSIVAAASGVAGMDGAGGGGDGGTDASAEGDESGGAESVAERAAATPSTVAAASQQHKVGSWVWRTSWCVRVLAFCVPLLSIPIADPLMSLIDIMCVGQGGSSEQLASLVPATLVFNFCSYCFFSVSATTTALLSREHASSDPKAESWERSASPNLATGLLIALGCGLFSAAFLLCMSPRLVGLTGAGTSIGALAVDYIQLRALAAPMVLVSMVAMSALIAWREPVLASLAVWASCIVNCSLDYVLILRLGWGVAGAAVATTTAQIVACVLLFRFVETQGGRRRPLPFRGVPMKNVASFWKIMRPLTITTLGKNLSYLLITSRAARMDVRAMASHQPVWQMFAFLSFTCAVLSQATIIFTPENKTRIERSEFSKKMLGLGLLTGTVTGGASVLLFTLFPALFTPDPGLWPAMATIAPYALLALALNGIDTVQEGLLISNREEAYLGRAMWVNALVIFLFSNALNLLTTSVSVSSVWWCLVVFFTSRVSINAWKLLRMDLFHP